MKDILLDIKNLHTHFPTKKGTVKAVDGVDLQIERGHTLGLVGESGCGKTMIALSIMGLVESPGRVVEGKILFNNEDLVKKSRDELRRLRGDRISMIFQDPTVTLNPVLRIGEQVAEVFRYHCNMDREEIKKRVIEVLDEAGIPDAKDRLKYYPFEFSGGMQQRVVIAISIALHPELLIADEPTTALDVTIQAQIIRLLKKLRDESESTIILITHDMGIVTELCDRVAVLYAGSIVEEADIATILEKPKHPYTVGLIESIPKLQAHGTERLKSIPGVLGDPTNLPTGCKFHPRCAFAMPICLEVRPKLLEKESGHKVACHLFTSGD